MSDKRIGSPHERGRAIPTTSVVLPYTETKGGEAVLFYEQSTRRTMPWQQSTGGRLIALAFSF